MLKENLLDDLDQKILAYLIENARIPYTDIAKKIGVSAGTIHVRVKKLEKQGILKGSTLILDYEKLGYTFIAHVGIYLTKSSKLNEVVDSLVKIPNVTVAYVITGRYNIFCKIRTKSALQAKDIIFKIDNIEHITRTETMISLEESINDKKRLMHHIFKDI